MAMQKKFDEVNYDARPNFGVKGWWILIFSAMNWFIYVFLANLSLSIVAPAKAEIMHVEPGMLLSWSTPARLVSLVFVLIMARVMQKYGVKILNAVCLVFGAGFCFLWGSSATVTTYVIAVFGIQCFMSVTELGGCNMLISNWFPRKKGIAIGIATCGCPLASIVGVALLTAMIRATGSLNGGLYVMAGITLFIALLNFIAVKNYPEEWGAYPDNDPNSKKREDEKLHTGWTWKKGLQDKELWLVSISNGILGLSTIAFVSTLIPAMMMRGFSLPVAISMLAISTAIGWPTSLIFGYIDQKFGTQKSAMLCALVTLAGIVAFSIPGATGAWLFALLIGATTGVNNSYPVSMMAQIFGRDGTQVLLPLNYVIRGVLFAFSYGIMGQSQVLTGGYGTGWIIIGVLTIIAMVLMYVLNFKPKTDPIEL